MVVYSVALVSRCVWFWSNNHQSNNNSQRTKYNQSYPKSKLLSRMRENSYGTQQFVASGSFDKTIKIWDISHKKLIATGTGHTQLIVSIKAFREQKQPRLASGSKDGTIKIWNCETYQLLHTIRLLPNDTIGQNSYCFLACLVSHNGYDNNNAEKRGCLFD